MGFIRNVFQRKEAIDNAKLSLNYARTFYENGDPLVSGIHLKKCVDSLPWPFIGESGMVYDSADKLFADLQRNYPAD